MRAPLADDVLSACALLTRLPLPAHQPRGAASAWAWPLVGALLGGFGAIILCLGDQLGLAAGPCAAIALTVMALATGALHEDGLADTADGLLGGRNPERRLAIMKDSQIGSFGAVALVLVTLISWSALSDLLAEGRGIAALIAAAALSRAPMAVLMAALPAARAKPHAEAQAEATNTGYSAAMGRPSAIRTLLAVAMALLISAVLIGGATLFAVAAIAVISALLARAAMTRIGGQTGDILGASQQLSFAAALTAFA